MSRYNIPIEDPGKELIVGWDTPMQCFFLQVYDLTVPDDEEECVTSENVRTLEDLHVRLRELGYSIDESTTHLLAGDKQPDAYAGRRPIDRLDPNWREKIFEK